MCSAPKPQPLPPMPDAADAAVRDAAAAERRRSQTGQGRKSTFLSGLLGDTSPMPVSGNNSFLGK